MDPKSNRNTSKSNAINNSSQQQLPRPKIDGYKLNDLIGKGSYGHVFKAEKKDTHDIVAIKCVPLKSLGKNSRDNIITEISILKKLKHDFIVQMLDFQWDKSFVYMIFEYCTGGELASIIRLKRNFPEDIVQHFLQQLASAMKYLRDNNVAHLDLKPQNILITGIHFIRLLNNLNSFRTWSQVILKIADFGFAQYLSNDESRNSLRGSPLYMAPEILKRQDYDARADLWSIGIILYECLFGRTPLHGMTTKDITQGFLLNTIKIIFPANPKLSELCFDLLKGLLKIDPNRRISFSNFFAHPFIDLEHMPTKDSYRKATEILQIAKNFEKQGSLKSAFYNFREALLYLVPLYRWGLPQQPFNAKKQEQLKLMIVKNMEKAEDLQQKCGLNEIDSNLLKEIQKIYNQIDRARDLASKDLHKQSFDKYEKALEKSMDILKCSDQKIKQEFFGDIYEWMSEAEIVKKKYLEEKRQKHLSENKSKKENESSKQPRPPSPKIQEELIVAEEAVEYFKPSSSKDDSSSSETTTKNDWYSKLKEPPKSMMNGHFKLKHYYSDDDDNITKTKSTLFNKKINKNPNQEDNDDNDEEKEEDEFICSIQ